MTGTTTRPSGNKWRVAVWGTGNVGRPAIRAVLANPALELVAVIVHAPEKVGIDVGDLIGTDQVGISATEDVDSVLAAGLDALVYAASGDFRPVEAIGDVVKCLTAGANVVTPAIYPLYHPRTAPRELLAWVDGACQKGSSTFLATGVDPGWAMDLLPLVLSGICGRIDEIRAQEIFDYSTYNAPDAVRNIVGFGLPMEVTPRMLQPESLIQVWGPTLNLLADGLGVRLEAITTVIERRPLERTIDVPGMGRFEQGTQGAMRFEVQGVVDGAVRLVVEHVTRITPDIATDWPEPPVGKLGVHKVVIAGRPSIEVTISADDGTGNPAEGGNSTAAGRLVNSIPAVCAYGPGLMSVLDLPLITGTLAPGTGRVGAIP